MLVDSVRPATVNVTTPLGRFSSDLGLKTNEASGMPSPSRSASCVNVVGSGRATPLTVRVVGSMSRNGWKPGVFDPPLRMKIWRSAGDVALIANGPSGLPTPIGEVMAVETTFGRGMKAPSSR